MADPADKSANPSDSSSVRVVNISGVVDCYGVGDTVDVVVDYSAPVVVTGTPTFILNALANDGNNIVAIYDKQKSTKTQLHFTYTVHEGDRSDASGYPAALTYLDENALQLKGATIKDLNGNSASLKLAPPPLSISDMLLDGVSPRIESVSPSAKNSGAVVFATQGTSVYLDVAYSEIIDFSTFPTLALDGGRTALSDSAGGSDLLRFVYSVQELDSAHPLLLASNTPIDGDVYDTCGNLAISDDEVGTSSLLAIEPELTVETTQPVLQSITHGLASGTYGVSSAMTFTATFSKSVTLSKDATLSLSLNSGVQLTSLPGAPTTSSTFVFNYTVEAAQTTGPADLGVTLLSLSAGGTLKDALVTNVAADLSTLPSILPVIKIDGIAPAITSVSASGSYGLSQTVPIAIKFSEAIAVTGAPLLTLTLSTSRTSRAATYASLSDASTMILNYIVQSADQGTPLDATGLSLNGGTITDTANNPAVLTLSGKNISAAIEASPLLVTSVSTSLDSGTYGSLTPLPITINFSRKVRASRDGALILTSGSGTREVSYYAADVFSSTLVLSYTIGSSDDKMAFNPYTLSTDWVDEYGNIFLTPPTFSSWDGAKTIVLDGKAPAIASVSSSPSSGIYGVDTSIAVTITFSEPVTSGNGNLSLTLSVGEGSKKVTSTVTNNSQVVFNYRIVAGDTGAITIANGTALGLGAGTTLGDYDATQTRRLNDASLSLGGYNFSGVTANTTPLAPTGLTAYSQAAADATKGSVNLVWTAPADPNFYGFAIWYSSTVDLTGLTPTDGSSPSSPPAGVMAQTTTSPNAIVGSLAARTSYKFKVWAYNSAYKYSSGSVVVTETPRNWNYNAYLKAVNSDIEDTLGGGLSADAGDESSAKGVDIAAWNYPSTPWMFAVAGAADSELELTGIENSDTVSLPGNKESSGDAGAVYVYKRDAALGKAWSHDAILHPHCQKSDSRRFGFSVAMSNKTIVVGEPRSNIKDSNASKFVTNKNGSNFTNDCTGWDATNDNVGGVFIYAQGSSSGGEASWSQRAFIRAPEDQGYDSGFGWSVALSGAYLVVGAANGNDNEAGAAFVYTQNDDATWSTTLKKLTMPNTSNSDRFGWSVAVDATTAVVGAPWEDGQCVTSNVAGTGCSNDSLTDSGAVLVYATNSSTSKNYLKAPNAGASDLFGFSVAISSDTIVVGAPKEDSSVTTITLSGTYPADNGETDRGAVYVFRRSGTNWNLEAELKAPVNTDGADPDIDGLDQFGWSVDIAGDTIVVGALYEDRKSGAIRNGSATNTSTASNYTNSGAAYIFRRTGTSWYPDGYLKPLSATNNNTNIADIRFGAGVAIDPATQSVIVAAPFDNFDPAGNTYAWTATVGTTSMNFSGTNADQFKVDMNTGANNSGAVYIFTP